VADSGRQISLLFDLFVAGQRVRRLIEVALADAYLRGDEYAMYSLLFELGPLTATEISRTMGMPLTTVLDHLRVMESRGHLRREPHPRDGRAVQISLTPEGLGEFDRTHTFWEPMRRQLEDSLRMPEADIRAALHALDDAARSSLETLELTALKKRSVGAEAAGRRQW